MQIKLPEQLECDHCVLQWRYHTGNSWGTDENGNSGIGLGNQEEFYGCADIEIVSTSISSPQFSTTTNIISSTTSSGAKTTTMTTSPQQTSTTTSKAQNSPNPEGPFCGDKNDGLYSHEKDCSLFYQCHQGITYEKNCPEGLYFNQNGQYCDWPANVNCPL